MRTSKVAALIVRLLPACSPLTYSKAGITNEDVSRDLSECTESARHEAFRDIDFADFQLGILHHRLHLRDRFLHGDIGQSISELQHRYRRVCMMARGYQLSPIED